jgi:hypothetical protein
MFHSNIEFLVIMWWTVISNGLTGAVKQTNCMCSCAVMQYLNEDASSVVLMEVVSDYKSAEDVFLDI